MTSTVTSATLTVTLTEAITLNGSQQGATNIHTIGSVNEVSKRIVAVPTTETTIIAFAASVSQGTFISGDVRYIRLTNKDDTNFVYLVFKNEYSNEFCVKLDKGQSYIYNPDLTSGVIDTMLANQVPLGFTESTGDTNNPTSDI